MTKKLAFLDPEESDLHDQLKIDPHNPVLHYLLGQLYRVAALTCADKTNRKIYAEKAWNYFNKAIDLSPVAGSNAKPFCEFTSDKFFDAFVERARISYLCRDRKIVARLAAQLLELANSVTDEDAGELLFYGYHLLGLLELDGGDSETATKFLLQSAECQGSPRLNSFGPSMVLAKRLLALGQSEAVLKYLSKCNAFWECGRKQIAQWSDDIRRGVDPDFGYNLNF